MRRRNLVIVRAGDGSLHPNWLAGPGERNWDLVVSYFGHDPDRHRAPDVVRIDGPGPKWPALHALLAERPELVAEYDLVWLPDDDLMIDKTGINRLFSIAAEYQLEVAQPALTWDSYFGHITTLRNSQCTLRYTNYVEVMAPCLTRAVLLASLPLFNTNLSGWGLDFVWSRFVRHPASGIAIVDAVTVRHTRPVGGPNYKALRDGGISPWDELRNFCRRNGIDENPVISTHAAIRRDGWRIDAARRKRRFAITAALGYIPALRHSPERARMIRRLAGMILKALCNIPDRVSEKPITLRSLALSPWSSRAATAATARPS